MEHRCSVCCILPPYLVKNLLNSRSEELRAVGREVLASAAAIRAERKIFSQVALVTTPATGKRRTIFDCHHQQNTSEATRSRGENETPVTDSAVNEAYEGVGITYDFYQRVYGRNSIDNRGMRLNCYVHYGRRYANAMWDGRQMLFGDGDGRVFSRLTQSVDIIGHELTHGVTQYAGNLEYIGESGALNESISDVFGSLVKQWHLSQTADQADWLIGADCFSPQFPGDALRSMKDPGTAYDNADLGKDPQPAHMSGYVQLPLTEDGDWGGVHINSGIPNHAFYLAAKAIGGYAWEIPGKIWYEAVHRCRKDSDFESFANLTYSVAREMFDSNSEVYRAVEGAWKEVGIQIGKRKDFISEKSARQGNQQFANLGEVIANLASQVELLRKDIDMLIGDSPVGGMQLEKTPRPNGPDGTQRARPH